MAIPVKRLVSLPVAMGVLEHLASKATGGTWKQATDCVVSDLEPATEGYPGRVIGESMLAADRAFIEAAQPQVIIALCERIRNYAGIAADLSREILDALDEPMDDPDAERGRIAFLDAWTNRLIAARHIEVP